MDVATKVLVNNLEALINRSVPMVTKVSEGVKRQVNSAAPSKLLSRCIGSKLLVAGGIAQDVQDGAIPLTRILTLHSHTGARLNFDKLGLAIPALVGQFRRRFHQSSPPIVLFPCRFHHRQEVADRQFRQTILLQRT